MGICRLPASARNSLTNYATMASTFRTQYSIRRRATNEGVSMINLLDNSFFPLFAIMAFAAVVLMVEALRMMWNTYRGPQAKKIEQRLRALSASSDSSARAAVLKNRMLSEMPAIDGLLMAIPRVQLLDRFLLQSGLRWTVAKLLL